MNKEIRRSKLFSYVNKSILFFWKGVSKITNTSPPVYYYRQIANRLLEEGKLEKAIAILEEGLIKHHRNYKIHEDLANIYINKKEWDKVIHHGSIVLIERKNKTNAVLYLELAKALRYEKKYNAAKDILEEGLANYPSDSHLRMEMSEVAVLQKDWDESIKHLLLIYDQYSGVPPARVFLLLHTVYKKLKQWKKAETMLKSGISQYPNDYKLWSRMIELPLQRQDWNLAKKYLETFTQTFVEKTPIDVWMKLAMIYQIIGNYQKASEVYQEIFVGRDSKELLEQSKTCQKMVLFDNGESRIEFYKQYSITSAVFITFDSINMKWDQDPFGYDFLLKQNVDIIAVRKRRKKAYHQDLSIDDFYNAVNTAANFYSRKISYGFSLGGYSALYFGSSLNSDILSLSPRNSAHPIYGEELDGDIKFNHSLSHPVNMDISPIVAYDPKNDIDREYIENEIKKSYPNGRYLEFPYAGHRIAPFFLQVGILKDIVLRVLNDEEIPEYRDIPRGQSSQYLRVLGNACLNRNKLKWAYNLGERAVEISPNDRQSNRLKIKALYQLGNVQAAIETAEKAHELIPKDKVICLLLINLYIEIGKYSEAIKITESAINNYKRAEEFIGIKEKLTEIATQ